MGTRLLVSEAGRRWGPRTSSGSPSGRPRNSLRNRALSANRCVPGQCSTLGRCGAISPTTYMYASSRSHAVRAVRGQVFVGLASWQFGQRSRACCVRERLAVLVGGSGFSGRRSTDHREETCELGVAFLTCETSSVYLEVDRPMAAPASAESSTSTPSGSQTVDRALSIVELFSLERSQWTLTEIATEMGLTVSTVHRLLKSLLAHEIVVIEPVGKRYGLGPGVMRMAKMLFERDDIHQVYEAAARHMSQLRTSTGETIGLHRILGQYRACVAELVSFQPVRTQTSVGGLQPLHVGAPSKSLIAWLTTAELDRLLPSGKFEKLTPQSPSERAELEAGLESVRRQGFAVSEGESTVGAGALSAPIFDRRNKVVASLNITGPIERWNRETMQAHVDELLDAVRDVSAVLGFSGSIP